MSVKTLRVSKGDRVVVNPTVSKREKEENIDLYDGYSFIGLGSDGGFAEFTNAPETNVYHLPDNVTAREGALVEPTAVAVQAVKEGELLFGDTVAVFGAGPIGLLTVIAAKAAGASKIFVFDLSEERLEKFKRWCNTYPNTLKAFTNPVTSRFTEHLLDNEMF